MKVAPPPVSALVAAEERGAGPLELLAADIADRMIPESTRENLRKQLDEIAANRQRSAADFGVDEIASVAAMTAPGFNTAVDVLQQRLRDAGAPEAAEHAVALLVGVVWPAPAFATPRPADRPSQS
jgi:uncharacterized membrane protein